MNIKETVVTFLKSKPKEEHESTAAYLVRELFSIIVIVVFIVLPFRLFIAQPFMVSGTSMDPTFHDADYLIVNQVGMHFTDLARDDVVVFRYPNDPSKFFIKRIIGLPGETVTISNNTITISRDGTSFVLNEPYITDTTSGSVSTTLGADEYFVMGDNRQASSDSRVWGPLHKKYIAGKPLVRVLPFTQFGTHPGMGISYTSSANTNTSQ